MRSVIGWTLVLVPTLAYLVYAVVAVVQQGRRGEASSAAIGGYVGSPADFMPTDEEWERHKALYDDEGGER